MAEFTKEQLIERARDNVESLKFASTQHAFEKAFPAIEIDIHLAEIALSALTAEPFMHGIVDPEGIAHMDENCVALKPWALGEEVDALNDECPEPPFKVVPLYRLPLLEGLK